MQCVEAQRGALACAMVVICWFCFSVFLSPATVSAGALDDYYLSRFAPKAKSARLSATGAPNGEVAERAERCLTSLHRDLKRDWKKLASATQQVLAKEISRPILAEEGLFPSAGGHFTIHYATWGVDAPDLTDADQNGTPDWVEKVGEVFDHVYQVEVVAMGYRPPPGTRYDVYLLDLTTQGVYGYTTTTGSVTVSSASYIEIDRAFTDPMYGSYTPLESLSVTAAHEYHHAVQFGYNYYFDVWYAEATATWMEDEVFDSVNQLYDYLPSYLAHSSTISLNGHADGGSEYGRWIFNRSLAERHSPVLVKDIWTQLAATAVPGDGSDIPIFPVIETVLGRNGSTLSGEFSGFAETLYPADWTTHRSDLSQIPAVAPIATFSQFPVTLSAASASVATLPHYSFAFYRFLPSATAPADLRLTLSNVTTGTDVVALKKGTDGSIARYPLDRQSGTITVPSFKSAQTAEVQLLVSNSSSSDGAKVSFSSNAVAVKPGAPTGVSATAGNAQATVSFTPPASDGGGAITSYTVTASPGSITAAAGASPITVTGLANGTAYTFTVAATNSAGTGAASAPSGSVTPFIAKHTLTLTFAGTGGGSVNGGVSCSKGTSCAPVQFVEDATVNLIPTPDADSLFGGWSSACTVNGTACDVAMDGDKTVTTTFNASPPLRILGGGNYIMISEAYASAANDAVIQTRARLFDDGGLTLNRAVRVFLKGGYDAGFSSKSGETAVKGKLLIRNGTTRVDGLVLR